MSSIVMRHRRAAADDLHSNQDITTKDPSTSLQAGSEQSTGGPVSSGRRPLLVDEWLEEDVLKFLDAAFNKFPQWPTNVRPRLLRGLRTSGRQLDGRLFVNLKGRDLRKLTRINKEWCRYIIRLRDDLISSIQLKRDDDINRARARLQPGEDQVTADLKMDCARWQRAADRINENNQAMCSPNLAATSSAPDGSSVGQFSDCLSFPAGGSGPESLPRAPVNMGPQLPHLPARREGRRCVGEGAGVTHMETETSSTCVPMVDTNTSSRPKSSTRRDELPKTEESTNSGNEKDKKKRKKKRAAKYKLNIADFPDVKKTPTGELNKVGQVQQASLFSFDPEREQWVRRDIECYIDAAKFDEGGMRSVYHMYELDRNSCADGSNATSRYMAKKFKQNRISHQAYFDEVLTQTVAESYAQQFNRICKKKVAFLPASVMQLDATNILYNVEPFLMGKYEKFSDNFGYVKRTNFKQEKYKRVPTKLKYYRQTIEAVAQTFSHFTYEISNHLLVVVDIQGVGSYYTDPQIHTYDGSGFGLGNFGAKGIAEFLSSHKCNKICKACKLTDYSDLSKKLVENGKLPQNERVPLMDLLAPDKALGVSRSEPGEPVLGGGTGGPDTMPRAPPIRIMEDDKRRESPNKKKKRKDRLHNFCHNAEASLNELRDHLLQHPERAVKVRNDIVHMVKVSNNAGKDIKEKYLHMAKDTVVLLDRLVDAGAHFYVHELKSIQSNIVFLRQLLFGHEQERRSESDKKAARRRDKEKRRNRAVVDLNQKMVVSGKPT